MTNDKMSEERKALALAMTSQLAIIEKALNMAYYRSRKIEANALYLQALEALKEIVNDFRIQGRL